MNQEQWNFNKGMIVELADLLTQKGYINQKSYLDAKPINIDGYNVWFPLSPDGSLEVALDKEGMAFPESASVSFERDEEENLIIVFSSSFILPKDSQLILKKITSAIEKLMDIETDFIKILVVTSNVGITSDFRF